MFCPQLNLRAIGGKCKVDFLTFEFFFPLRGLSIHSLNLDFLIWNTKEKRKRSLLFFNVSSRNIGYGKSQLSIQSSIEPVMVSFSQLPFWLSSRNLWISPGKSRRTLSLLLYKRYSSAELMHSVRASYFFFISFYLFTRNNNTTQHVRMDMNDPVAVAADYFFLRNLYTTRTCCVRTRCVYIFSCQVCISKSWIVQLHYS